MTEPTEEHADDASPRRVSRRSVALAGVVGAVLLGLAAVYGIGGLAGNAPGPGICADAPARAARLKPFVQGEVAAFVPAETGRDLSALPLDDVDGRRRTLADWRGRVVLLNLWATWCVPCRVEMPGLDRLQARAGGPDFEVVTVGLDTRDPEKPRAFLKEIGVTALVHRTDKSLEIFRTLQKAGLASGLPTTLLIDRTGCELGHVSGPAAWDGREAAALVGAAIADR